MKVLHGCEFTIFRREDTEEKGGLRMMLLVKIGVFAQPVNQMDRIPSPIAALQSFHYPSSVLEMSCVQRGVPINGDSFLITLFCDEPRRIIATKFDSIVERRAFGDLLDAISLYSYNTDYGASITERELNG